MGVALELVSGHVTAPGTTLTAWTVNTGNSLTIKNAPIDSEVSILTAWAVNQGAGTLRIRSPKLHDNVQGLRFTIPAASGLPLFPRGVVQRVFPMDTLTIEQSGSAGAGDIEIGALLLFYQDLPGVDARLSRAEDILGRVKHIFTVENTLALGTSGDYTGEEAITAEFDLFKANTDYALLGYRVSARAGLIRFKGTDTGNLGLGGPAEPDFNDILAHWFVYLSTSYDIPAIPILNSNNRANFTIDGVQDENGTDVTVTTIFAELS
ncbi:MAG: hypothetical protein QXD59_02970 [Candidatus Caldarchaeum sp.]